MEFQSKVCYQNGEFVYINYNDRIPISKQLLIWINKIYFSESEPEENWEKSMRDIMFDVHTYVQQERGKL